MGQQFAQHGAGPRVERHLEAQVELVLGVIGTLAGEREALGPRSGSVDLDLGERLVLGDVPGPTSSAVARRGATRPCGRISSGCDRPRSTTGEGERHRAWLATRYK